MTKPEAVTRLLDALDAADDARRRNPSRYTSDGYLKPVCAAGQHKPFKDSLACEVCGLVVDGVGAVS